MSHRIKSSLLSFLLVCIFGIVGAQTNSIEDITKQITPDRVSGHIKFLASDALEGRETGERGQKLAALYIESQFIKLGLKAPNPSDKTSGYFQSFRLSLFQYKNQTLTLKGNKTQFQPKKDFLTPEFVLEPVNGKLVILHLTNDFSPEKLLINPEEAKGKAVLVSGILTDSMLAKLKKLPFSMICWAPETDYFEELKTTRSVFKMYGDGYLISLKIVQPAVPVIFLSQEFNTLLLSKCNFTPEQAQSGKLKETNLSMDFAPGTEQHFIDSENVIGLIEGTDKKEEIIVISAHYDHLGIRNGEVYNGADDDASGTSALLSIAEAFASGIQNGIRPSRSIAFIAFTGEEKGLMGSSWFVENPVFQLKNIVCDLNIDMIGRIDPAHEQKNVKEYIYLIGSDKISKELHELSESVNKQYFGLELDYTYNDEKDPNRFYYRSDHYNFARFGIPVIFYFSGTHADYHKPGDDWEKIDFEKASKITQLVFRTAYAVASLPKRVSLNSER